MSQLNSIINQGFPWLIFPKPLEIEFQSLVRRRILNRISTVGISACLFILAFCGFDWLLFPESLARHTITLRLTVVLPVITIMSLWLYFKPPKYYLWLYSGSLFICNMSIIYIIWLAHIQEIDLPYEGLMITMMYGFFIMALPFYLAFSINATMVAVYSFVEPYYYLDFANYFNNVILLTIIFLSAAFGAYVTEHNQRSNFLRKRLLDMHHDNALQSIKQKNKYLAVASHDIRQPLQGITLIANHMEDLQPNDDRVKHLNQGLRSLNDMFNQLLDISKINLNMIKPRFKYIQLFELVQQNIDALKERSKQKNIRIENRTESIRVISDFTILNRVLSNLLENALIHSHCDHIQITTDIQSEWVDLKVMDNGQGIDKQLQQHIFDEFSKGKDSKNGLGLGLAIVSQFCQQLGCLLSFSSDKNNTTFNIRIPINKSIYIIDNDSNPIPQNLKQSILVIDDDNLVLNQLNEKLTSWGFLVTCATGIEQGLIHLKHSYSCVISDWDLPDGCGEKILEHCQINHIPCLLISSISKQNIEKIGLNMNCHYLQKPISPTRLRTALTKLISA